MTPFTTNWLSPLVSLIALVLAPAMAVAADAVPTGRLPRDVELRGTKLELRIDPRASSLTGRIRLAIELKRASTTLWLHGRDLTIERASITPESGKAIQLTARQVDVSGVLRFTAPTALPVGPANVDITYSALYGNLQGAYKVRSGEDDYVLTHMEPLGARNVFPGFDEPSFKKPWDLTLIVPSAHVAVANSPQIKEEILDSGWKKVTFARTENLPSYLIAFAVGPWDVVEWKPIAPNAIRARPLNLRGVAVNGQGKRMTYALEHTAEIVRALESYFGSPYPYEKLDLIAAPDFAIGAMENAGIIIYHDSILFANDDSPANVKQGYWVTHAHELSHQWFGNLVTMPWWDDVWLKEAFATWMGSKIAGELQPSFHTDRLLMEDALRAMNGDSLGATRRIREPVDKFTDIRSAFDSITYSKGGAVLAMMERYVGEAVFRDGVRAYLQKHAGGNATNADLITEIAQRSSDPAGVHAAFDSFLDQPGVPLVRASLDCATPGKPMLRLEQNRFLPLGSQAVREQHWNLPLCVRYEDAGKTRKQCALVREVQTRLPLQTRDCPRWVMTNAQGAGYYRFALDMQERSALNVAFNELDEREQRAYADSLVAAFKAGTIDVDAYLATLPRMAAAAARQTVTSPFSLIDWMIEHLTTDRAGRARVRDVAAKAYRARLDALGMDPKPGEIDEDRLLRTALVKFIAETAKVPELRATLAKRGRAVIGLAGTGDGKLDVAAVSIDLREIALVMAAQEGDAATFDVMLKHLEASQDSTLRSHLASALGSFRQPSLVERAHSLVLRPGLLRLRELSVLLSRQSDIQELRTGQRRWIDERFAELTVRLAPAGAGLVGFYAHGLCGSMEAGALQKTFEARIRNMEGGPRLLAQEVEALRLCGALRDAQAPAVRTSVLIGAPPA